jgi:hypothetical protein
MERCSSCSSDAIEVRLDRIMLVVSMVVWSAAEESEFDMVFTQPTRPPREFR